MYSISVLAVWNKLDDVCVLKNTRLAVFSNLPRPIRSHFPSQPLFFSAIDLLSSVHAHDMYYYTAV